MAFDPVSDSPTPSRWPVVAAFAGMVAAFVLGTVPPDAGQITTFVGIGTGIACAATVAMLVALRQPSYTPAPQPARRRVTIGTTFSDPVVRQVCLAVFFPVRDLQRHLDLR